MALFEGDANHYRMVAKELKNLGLGCTTVTVVGPENSPISPDAKSLTVLVTVEDPDTFNGPLTLKNIWRRNNVAIEESVCADDGGLDHFQQNLYPIPVADKADF